MTKTGIGLTRFAIICILLIGVGIGQAQAQSGGSVTERLIELLVEKGVLPRDQAAALLHQAQQEARASKIPPKQAAAKAATPVATPADEPVPPGTVRVTYVPQIVRNQIAEQVRNEMMQQAKTEGWAQPNVLPEWTQRITVFGDMRIRGEGDFFPHSSSPNIVDFATINSGSPFDITGSQGGPPLLDTTENRWRVRLRARIGVDARIDDWLTSEIRLATGNDASPISTNQTLGQSGPFAKYALWLDRAFVKATPTDWMTINAGRMSNPFWTTDLIYYDDLAFDGFAVTATPRIGDEISGFVTAGAFPVFNTAFNFGTTTTFASRNAWLFGVQAGGEWRFAPDYVAKLGAGYFGYSNIAGKTSSPCLILFSSDACNTDNSRMLFTSNGNTMFAIRNLLPNPNNPTGPQPQFFGLASGFNVLDLHGRLDLQMFKPINIALEGEFADNLAFSRTGVARIGVNNFGPNNTVEAGNKAWMLRVTVGTPQIAKRWDWNAWLAYKYLESDSVLAALTDPDFHLGGTNAKGFILGGNLGIARNAWITARWLSASQVSGPPYAVDVVQADLNVRF
jgi:Putative porin